MPWYQLLVPAAAIAILVRAEAILIGPYWAWIELLPLAEDEATRRARRHALIRRLAIPGVAAFGLVTAWRATYSEWDAVLVAATAVGLLLWPALIHGLPWSVRARDWEVGVMYAALVVGFGASAWLGSTISTWIATEYGSLGSFVRQELVSFLLATVVVAFAAGIFDRVAEGASRRGDDHEP